MRIPSSLSALRLFLVLCARTAAASPATISLPLVVNQVNRGEVTILLNGDDVFVREVDLAAAGIRTEAMVGEILRKEGDTAHDYVSLSSLSPYLSYSLDEMEVVLRLQVRPDFLQEHVLDLRARRRPVNLQRTQAPAAFLNYAVHGDVAGTVDPSFGYAAEVGASASDFLVHSTLTGRDDGTLVRGLSRARWDFPGSLTRLTLGDEFAGTTALGGAGFVGGIHFARRFELDPWLLRTPLPTLSGAAETPTSLEVYVDGVLVRRERIEPGTFEVRNLPISAGAGQVQYVLRDAFGREVVESSSYVVDGRLLRKGMSDFSYTLGFRRERLGTESFSYGRPVFLGVHRLGLIDDWTAGGRLEAGEDFVSGSGHSVFRLPFGVVSVEGSGSRAGEQTGAAAVLGWTYVSRGLGLSLWSQAVSERYAHASLDPEDDRPLLDAGASLSLPMASLGSVTARQAYRRMRDRGEEHRSELHLHWKLGRGAMLTTSGTRWVDSTGPQFEVFASLGFVLSPGATAHAWARGNPDYEQSGFSVQEYPLGDTGWEYRAAVKQGERSGADLGVGHRGSNGIVRADVQTHPDRTVARGEVAGALVAMGGGIHLSRPIDRSFALVRVPGVPDATVRLNHREVGRTDARGELLVPGLQSYDANRISVDYDDLPSHLQIEELDAFVTAPSRGGALVEFRPKRVRSIRGRIARTSALPVRHGTLVVRRDGKEEHFLLGSRGQFEVDLPSGHYEAEVRDARGVCTLELRIPDVDEGIVDLGLVQCTQEVRL